MIYREMIGAGLVPSMEMLSQVLGCLQLPKDVSLKKRLIESLRINSETSRSANLFPLIDGFAEYDPRASSLFEVSSTQPSIFGPLHFDSCGSCPFSYMVFSQGCGQIFPGVFNKNTIILGSTLIISLLAYNMLNLIFGHGQKEKKEAD